MRVARHTPDEFSINAYIDGYSLVILRGRDSVVHCDEVLNDFTN